LRTLERVAEFNNDSNNTSTVEINEFADWTDEEMQKMFGARPVGMYDTAQEDKSLLGA